MSWKNLKTYRDIFDEVQLQNNVVRLSNQLTLGQILVELSSVDKDANIVFDDGGAPGRLWPYKEYPHFLSLNRCEKAKVGEVRSRLRSAINATFASSNGEKYVMKTDTLVWVSEPHKASGLGVTGVKTSVDCRNVTLTVDQIEKGESDGLP